MSRVSGHFCFEPVPRLAGLTVKSKNESERSERTFPVYPLPMGSPQAIQDFRKATKVPKEFFILEYRCWQF
jgi:hypothetical protein